MVTIMFRLSMMIKNDEHLYGKTLDIHRHSLSYMAIYVYHGA